MFKKVLTATFFVGALVLSGCASVPMESQERDSELKQFNKPEGNQAGVYIFRNQFAGQALKKDLYIDGNHIGETANGVYFYKAVAPGKHVFSTESEFSDNSLELDLSAGVNYFIRQYIKLGLFVGGANLEVVSEEEGKKEVLQTKLAKETPQK